MRRLAQPKRCCRAASSVIIERYFTGTDYRLLVVGNKLVAASARYPAAVTGNGIHSIQQLVDAVNASHERGDDHDKVLTKIKIDQQVIDLLAEQSLTPESIPATGEYILLRHTANLSTGSTAEDVTDIVHPDNIFMAERAAKIIGLDVCGIDIISPDITKPLTENGGAILEINAAPGPRMHVSPCKGQARNVASPIMDLLFPHDMPSRIPVVAVTGTNGKTTTARLVAHIAAEAGLCTGFTTTDGIYLNGRQIKKGDCSDPVSARVVLDDPFTEFAVLECARGGIIRSGLAFDQCDVGIVTNVAEDHLGLKDVYTIDDLARVKSVVPQAVKKQGWAVLNAADDRVYTMRTGLECNIALFAMDVNHPRLLHHINKGGLIAGLDQDGAINIRTARSWMKIENAAAIPLTMNGKAGFMIENILAAALAAFSAGFTVEQIRSALLSFGATPEQTPGRINQFPVNGVNIIVDYAHNPHGLRALKSYLQNIPGYKIGIITGTGDRRDNDIVELGRIAAETYDEIIIRIDKDTRGRPPENIIHLLKQGISMDGKHIPCRVIPDTEEALLYGISNGKNGSYVVISADDALQTVEIAKKISHQFAKTDSHA
jgi:cyanophycin synthetase